MYYETEGMAQLRQRMNAAGFSDDEFDSFKAILVQLEGMGFRLKGPILEEI